MALSGNLKEFGLPDILQLIYYQKKTGVLRLDVKQDSVNLLFNEGNIIGAESAKSPEAQRLGRIILKKGLMDEKLLKEALDAQKQSGLRLGSQLVKLGYVKADQLRDIIEAQMKDLVIQTFSWKEGKYEFKPMGVPVDKALPVALDTQHLLMDGLRVVDEWSTIQDKISMDTVFERTGAKVAGLNQMEAELLKIVDGKNSVAAIVDTSMKDSYEASKSLLGLEKKGFIRRSVVQAAGASEKPLAEKKIESVSAIGAMAFVLMPLAIIAGITSFYMRMPDSRRFLAEQSVSGLRIKIDVYKEAEGSYPSDLMPLGDPRDPWGSRYFYTTDENGFVLASPGPDKQSGTPDDTY